MSDVESVKVYKKHSKNTTKLHSTKDEKYRRDKESRKRRVSDEDSGQESDYPMKHTSKKKSSKSHKSKSKTEKHEKELEAIRNNYGSDEDVPSRKKELRKGNRESDSRSKRDSRSKIRNNSPGKRRSLDYEKEGHDEYIENDKSFEYTNSSRRHQDGKDEEYLKKYDRKKSKIDDYYDRERNEELRNDYRRRGTEFTDRRERKERRYDSDFKKRTDYDEPEKERFSGFEGRSRDQREDHRHRKKQRKEEEKENEFSEFSKSSQKKHEQASNSGVDPRRDPDSSEENKRLKRSRKNSDEAERDSLPASNVPTNESTAKKIDDVEPLSKRQKMENINVTARTGGAYIPPARLRMMQEKIKDKGSEEYQKIAWEALKKSIVGMTNKVNGSNIGEIVPELFKENIIRGRGILARSIMQAQAASPTFTRVYAALVAIINTKFPEIGELILKRLIIQYKRGFRRNDKIACMTATRFIAHLLNQEVAHEVLILEIVTHLLENPTGDTVEIAISTLKECGKKLKELTSRGMRAITDRVRDVLHEGQVDVRVRYMIEVFFAVQKDGFKDFETIPPELDLVEEEDKYTHLINLDDAMAFEEMLNVFKFDPLYIENEEKYKAVAKEILEGGSDSEDSGEESDGEEEDEDNKDEENQQIIDMTETNIVCLRRKIYLTIQSSLDFEECAHKLLKLELKPGQILEMCYMILDCCAQQRTYEKFFGLLAQRFCQLSKVYVEPFTEIFENSYKTIHRLETNKLRNVAKFFAHLLYTDAISWMVLASIKLNEEDTTSSSRIFIKILFQELCEYMGLSKLNDRVKDVTLQEAFDGLFPRDHPHNTRFAINFFTSIGLGGLTDELREYLKNLPKTPAPIEPEAESSSSSSSDSSSSSSSSSSSDSSDSSSD